MRHTLVPLPLLRASLLILVIGIDRVHNSGTFMFIPRVNIQVSLRTGAPHDKQAYIAPPDSSTVLQRAHYAALYTPVGLCVCSSVPLLNLRRASARHRDVIYFREESWALDVSAVYCYIVCRDLVHGQVSRESSMH